MRDLLSKDHKKKLELRERPDTGVYVQVCTTHGGTTFRSFIASQEGMCTHAGQTSNPTCRSIRDSKLYL